MMRALFRSLEVWATVGWSWLALRCWPERELANALSTSSEGCAADASLVASFHRTTRAIARGRCLLLSVALLRILRRRGMQGTLQIGFALGGEALPGHAWVACGLEEPANGSQRFQSFHCTAQGLAAFVSRRRAMNISGGFLGH